MKYIQQVLVFVLILVNCKSSDSIIRKVPTKTDIQPSSEKFFSKVLPTLSGKKVLLVTNPSGIGIYPEKLIQSFKENKVKIQYLIGLEHGFLGLEEDFSTTPVTIDPTFNVPIYHIYKLKSSDIQLLVSGVDAIVFDVQDMGMRCYTYLTVLKRLMEQTPPKTEFIVLDHISPGMEVLPSGEEVKSGNENFAAEFPLLFFTGLSLGESANYFNSEFLNNKVKMTVLPVENYKRGINYEKTGLAWNTPSPNLPTLDSARNYLSLVFLEGINVSVGRGTQAPFIYFGAPYFRDIENLVNELNSKSNEEYYFQPVFFRPSFGPFKEKICRGMRLTIVNLNYNPIKLAYNLIQTLKEKHKKDLKWTSWGTVYGIDHLWGTDHFRKSIDANKSFEEFQSSFSKKEQEYLEKVKKYYLY
jgi:uncharacterized protein YbbC (DUF1343 family)